MNLIPYEEAKAVLSEAADAVHEAVQELHHAKMCLDEVIEDQCGHVVVISAVEEYQEAFKKVESASEWFGEVLFVANKRTDKKICEALEALNLKSALYFMAVEKGAGTIEKFQKIEREYKLALANLYNLFQHYGLFTTYMSE